MAEHAGTDIRTKVRFTDALLCPRLFIASRILLLGLDLMPRPYRDPLAAALQAGFRAAAERAGQSKETG